MAYRQTFSSDQEFLVKLPLEEYRNVRTRISYS